MGHPSSCLLKMVPSGDSGEAAKRKDVFLGGVFGFFQESFLGQFYMAPHSVIRESLQHKRLKGIDGLCYDI